MYRLVHYSFPLTLSILSLFVYTLFCSCLITDCWSVYLSNSSTKFVTMASKEALEAEVARLTSELDHAHSEVDKLNHEATSLSEHLAKSELQRSQMLEKEQMREDLERKNEDLISKFMAITTKLSESKVIVNPSRRLDRFKGKPVTASDPSVEEWIRDVKVHLASRSLEGEKAVLFILDHLAGKARLDIIGRLDSMGKDDPDTVFSSLRNTLGDGDTIPQLLQRFFSYTQSPTEDLVSCSLNLLEIYDRIDEHDHTFKSNRNTVLKERLAEAVRDEGLKRELRRLNTENPRLSYFEFRDRGDKWIGKVAKKSATNVEAVRSQQTVDIEKLKKDIVSEVVQALRPSIGRKSNVQNGTGKKVCWECGSENHFKADCPTWKEKKTKKKEVSNQENDVRINNGKFLEKAVGVCPETIIDIKGVKVRCLLDTGAEVSTMTESFFRNNFDEALADVSDYVKITAANGLHIPFLGYYEPPISIFGREVKEAGFLVVKDSEDMHLADRKRVVPGVIGSNILSVLANAYEPEDFDKSEVSFATSILGLYNQEILVNKSRSGFAKVQEPVIIPGRSLKQINVKVPLSKSGPYEAIIERHACSVNFPNGVAIGRTLVTVDKSGKVPIQVANFSENDILLKTMRIGSVCEIDVPSPIHISKTTSEIRVSLGAPSEQVKGPVDIHFDVGDCLNSDQQAQLETLLKRHINVFSKDEYDVGTVNAGIEHHIRTVDDQPVKVPYRRVPPNQWTEVRDYLQKALDKQVIRPSSSPYAAPVVLVRKPNGDLRMCVDYRQLNNKVKKDSYPLPRIEDALESLKGACYFSSLDLAHGYHQVPVAQSDIEKTAFRVGTGGLYEFLKMPFGLSNALATFMRMMDKIFGDQNFQTLLIYLDDILVPASSFEQMLERLEMVFSRLEQYSLKVKPEKCHFFKEEIHFLGHVVCEGGIGTDPEKTRAIEEWSPITNESELRSFLGLASYYRRYVKNFAAIAAPLHRLLNGGSKKKHSACVKSKWPECWTEDCEQAFRELKSKLTTAPILGYPDFSRPFILEIDASFEGLGAVLSQDQEEGRVVISYASRGLRPHERNMQNYSSMKLTSCSPLGSYRKIQRLSDRFQIYCVYRQLSAELCAKQYETWGY